MSKLLVTEETEKNAARLVFFNQKAFLKCYSSRSFYNLIKSNNNVVKNCQGYEVRVHYVLKELEIKDTLKYQALSLCATLKSTAPPPLTNLDDVADLVTEKSDKRRVDCLVRRAGCRVPPGACRCDSEDFLTHLFSGSP